VLCPLQLQKQEKLLTTTLLEERLVRSIICFMVERRHVHCGKFMTFNQNFPKEPHRCIRTPMKRIEIFNRTVPEVMLNFQQQIGFTGEIVCSNYYCPNNENINRVKLHNKVMHDMLISYSYDQKQANDMTLLHQKQ